MSQTALSSDLETVVAHDHHGCPHSHHDDEASTVELSVSDASPCGDPHECHEGNCLYVTTPSPALTEGYACSSGVLVYLAPSKTHSPSIAFTGDSLRPHLVAGCSSAPDLCAHLQSWQI